MPRPSLTRRLQRLAGCIGLLGSTLAGTGSASAAAPGPAGAGGPSGSDPPPGAVVLAEAFIDAAGGELQVPTSAGALGGARVVFPAGAVAHRARATLSWEHATVPVRAGTASGIVVTLAVEGSATFARPVTLELPDPDMPLFGMPVPYRIDPDGHLHVAQLQSWSRLPRRLVIVTFTPGRFTWVHG